MEAIMRSIAAVSILSLVLLATPHSAAAQQQQSSPTQASKSRSSHRTLWTIVGIGAGFVGGMLIGMHEFDDAINSSQKVWMSSIAGAAAGGLAGNLLSANQAPTTATERDVRVSVPLCLRVPGPARVLN
jgi:hypothetical protein